jgi:glycosyltransferase involved in cell wall biosynthesis
MTAKLFYFVDDVANFEGNHGIHRVSRRLARGFVDAGADVVFVSWLASQKRLTRSSDDELRRFARWGGPAFRPQCAGGTPLEEDGADRDDLHESWLLVPELPYHTGKDPDTTGAVIADARRLGLRVAFLLHDLIPVRTPGYAPLRDRHAQYLRQMAAADVIVPVSVHVERDLRRYYRRLFGAAPKGLPYIKAQLLPDEAPDAPRAAAPETSGHARLEILCVGALEPRKNHRRLLQAFERVMRRRGPIDCRLTLVGDHHARTLGGLEKLMRGNPRVRFLGRIDDDALRALYQSCDFTVFPSLEEGYGLPIVESLWFGKPALCANFGAMAEAAEGGGCLTVDTRRVSALAAGLERLTLDAACRRELAEAAVRRRPRTWLAYARELRALLEARSAPRDVCYWVDFTVRHPINTGVQRVTRSLARALQDLGAKPDFVAWDYARGSFCDPDDAQRRHLGDWNGPLPEPPAPRADDDGPKWLVVPEILSPPEPSPREVIRQARARGLKTAFLFYDLIPLKLRELYADAFVDGFVGCWKAMAEADLILPISATSGAELAQFYARELRMSPERLAGLIRPVPMAGAFAQAPRQREARSRGGGAVSILCVGTIEPRKNQLRLIEAVTPLWRAGHDISLTIAGASHSFPQLAAELRARIEAAPNVRYLDGVDDQTLAGLYSACDFTVYASQEEGFGLPILESLWHGRPCLCHNAGAIAEVAAAGGCLTADMRDVAALRAGLLELASDRALYDRLAAEAVSRPIKTWAGYAREVERALAGWTPEAPRGTRAILKGLATGRHAGGWRHTSGRLKS